MNRVMLNKVVTLNLAAILSFAILGCSDNDNEPDVARGEYLARSVLGCGLCHTPYNPDGTLNQGSWLAGNGSLADFVPDDDTMGLVPGPNLTSSATAGLGDWTDAEIKAAITKGVKPNGDAMLSFMPYYEFALLSDADLDALVAYLRTLPASDTIIDPRQPLPFPVSASPALAASDMPNHNLASSSPDFASAENGKHRLFILSHGTG